MSWEVSAVCGNNCKSCPRYTATRSNELPQLKRVAALWFEMGFRDTVVSIDEIRCDGCSSSSPCVHGVRQCADKKGLRSCGLCPDYPCTLVNTMLEKAVNHEITCKEKWSQHYPVFKDAFFSKKRNLDSIKEKPDK